VDDRITAAADVLRYSAKVMNIAIRPSGERKLHVLLADDERDTIRTLTELLVREGHSVSAVYSGTQIVPAIRRDRPDVCIIDIEMPGQSGYTTAQEIEARLPEPERPFLIAISGKWTAPSDRLLAEMVGFRMFFLKPAEPDAILRLLDDIATGGK
jgi:CheY-like chemotaxis protein